MTENTESKFIDNKADNKNNKAYSDIELGAGERIDILDDKGYKIIQDEKLYCFNMDAVLISDFAKAKHKDIVLDIGCGNWIIPLLMHSRYQPECIYGVEITEASYDLAKRSVTMNKLEAEIELINDDAKNLSAHFPPSYFDVIVSNPPYMEAGLRPDEESVSVARHEVKLSFDELAEQVARHIKVGGSFYLVHRTYRLVDIIASLRKYKLEPKEIRFVKPYAHKESNVFLLRAVRGGKTYLKALPDLVIYDDVGVYTEELKKIYRW